MFTGKMKWFNHQKGFGFIQQDENGDDVFVHITAFEKAGIKVPDDGKPISYDIDKQKDGRVRAVNLKA